MGDAVQTFLSPILVIYDDTSYLAIADGAEVEVTFELIAFPALIEYVRCSCSGAGPFDVEISQDAFTLDINTIYQNLAATGDFNDNLLKPVPVGRFHVTITPTSNGRNSITVAVEPEDEEITVKIANDSGGARSFVLEIGYRLMNRGIDLQPSTHDDVDAVDGVTLAQISAQSL